VTETLAVETGALVKRYENVLALAGLDLAIEPGCFFGLLGPNGAGKTTAVSILCTLLRPTSGEARVFGKDVVRERPAVRPLLGIVFQDPSLDTELTGRENLDIHARLYRLPERAARIEQALDMMDMARDADRGVRSLSGGMRRRLEIARGLLHGPSVLFLDEPTLGLDVHARRSLWQHLERLRDGGLTLVLTTHAMDEAARLCERVAILNEGRIVAAGTPRELCQEVGGDHIEMELDRPEDALPLLRAKPNVRDVWMENRTVVITVEHAPTELVPLIETLKALGIHAVRMREVNLEDAFVHFTGHKIDTAGNLA
jgi:ABC-2 type transport system ATP-binding protein